MEQKELAKAEAQKRFDALPENLKKELLADKNTKLISDICRDYSIPEDKVKLVALVTGEVFLGYMKPEEIAAELNQHFQIDLQKANFIEIELKQKLFNGLKADLEKIYNPPKIESEEKAEEYQEAAPLSTISTQSAPPKSSDLKNVNPPSLENDKNPIKPIAPITKSTAASTIETSTAEPAPFIIQTKVEAIKPNMPQFSGKEALSLNLKADSSFTAKPAAVKPVSVRLESEQLNNNVKFTMPVFTNKQPATSDKQQITAQQPKIEIPQKPTIDDKQQRVANSPQITSQPEKQRPITAPINSEKLVDQTLSKPISELKPIEEPRVVHYSNFKTPLTPIGTPKKPEPKKEDYINLTTFTKVSGNTVDLRKSTDQNND